MLKLTREDPISLYFVLCPLPSTLVPRPIPEASMKAWGLPQVLFHKLHHSDGLGELKLPPQVTRVSGTRQADIGLNTGSSTHYLT